MTKLRERWEGVSLPGDYLLERWLNGDEDAGFFETPPMQDGRRAVIKLVPESAVDGSAQLALWQLTRRLRHPNLRELLDCGRAVLSGETVLFAVFEPADETLAGALAQAPLTEAESRELLHALRDALSFLQDHGLTHSALDPDHILAVGEAIKLSSDALREAPAATPYTEALRAFWYRVSPFPLARSADLLAQALDADPHRPPAPDRAEILPVAEAAARPAAPLALESTAPPSKRFPKWVLVGAAGVVLLILGLNFRRSPEAPPEPSPAPASAPVVASPVPQANPTAERISQPSHQPSHQPAPKPTQTGKAIWRVIAFTYRTQSGAARKAEQVNQLHPDLEATVFSPSQKEGYYLVALGGRMSREGALKLQKKARAERLARDVYIKNFLD